MAITDYNTSEMTAAGDLDVPEFMKDDYTAEKTPRPRGESPAMVAARRSGHRLGTAWHLARIGGTWFATGARQARLDHRYWVTAVEYEEKVGITTDVNWERRADLRRARRRTTAAGAGGGIVVTVAAAVAVALGTGLPVSESLVAAPATEAVVAGAIATGYGRRIINRKALEAAPTHEAIEPGAILEDDGPPFPLAQAYDAEQARTCVLRALKAEGVPVADVYDVVRREWGWQCVVRVSEGTPEAVISKAGALETRFDLPTNGVRTQPMVERRACAILRLVSGDPFATAPALPYRAPLSLSILDKTRYGTSVGGDPLAMSFAGVMGLVVAASGGGKTGVLQAIGEITTACRDNVTIDIDPHGDGLEDLHDAVRLTARTTEQIEAVLLFLLMLSKGRARLRKKLGMGRKWEISAQRPHITVPFDEFPKASKLAKKLAFDLLLVGRKEAVTEILASQGGTTLYLGENIAQMIAFKAVGPCKVGDTRAVFGDGAVGEGWLPHKLSPATDTDPKDAGHLYVQGVPGMPDEPIEYKTHEIPSAVLRKLATERRDAGLVEPDQESLDAMREVDLPDYVLPEYDAEGNLKKEAPVKLLTWDQLLRLCDAEPAAGAVPGLARTVLADAIDLMDRFGVDRMRTETLLAALADHDPGAYGEMTADELKAHLAEAGAGKPVTLGQIDGMNNPRGFKREQLAAAM